MAKNGQCQDVAVDDGDGGDDGEDQREIYLHDVITKVTFLPATVDVLKWLLVTRSSTPMSWSVDDDKCQDGDDGVGDDGGDGDGEDDVLEGGCSMS